MSEEERVEMLSRLRDLPSYALKAELRRAQDQVRELQQNFNQLRSGGCALETLLEEARSELELIEELLKGRGEKG